MGDCWEKLMNLLLFNPATDVDDPVLGFTAVWIQALAQHCETIHVLTMRQGRLDLPDNISIYSVGKEKGYSEPRRAIEFYRHLTQILANHRIDACFAHMTPLFAVMGAPLLKAKGIPIVLWYTHKQVTLCLRLGERLVDVVVTASEESFNIDSPKKRVIGHGIDTTYFKPNPALKPHNQFIVVSVGRISPIKDYETLLRSAHIIIQRRNSLNAPPKMPIHFRIVGGPATEANKGYLESLKYYVVEHGLQSIIEFSGPVPFREVVKEYQSANLMVNLCPTGGLDKAVLEAMACGLPVLTSNAGFRAWLDNRFLFEKGNANELANKILAFAENSKENFGFLRELVVKEHSLFRLSETLYRIFSALCTKTK